MKYQNNIIISYIKNKSLIFTIKDESILVEKSIFLGANKILDSIMLYYVALVNKWWNKAGTPKS